MREDILKERRLKLARLKEFGFDPYPAKTKRSIEIGKVLKDFDSLKKNGKKLAVIGRVRSVRGQGKIVFFDLADMSGRVQVVVKKDILRKNFSDLMPLVEVGDFLEINGVAMVTQRGEKSIEAKSIKMATKSLRPLPTDYYGIEDKETLLRKRYLDLLLNSEVKEMFVKKSKMWQSFRGFLIENGFMEVETPVLESVPGGAEAEPFITHHNALDEDFYLRISLEISLKKLMVGGFERVFEIGRVFRNEGIDADHLQDYTALELYYAYADYNDLMILVEKMYKRVIKDTFGKLVFKHSENKVDWGKKWKRVDYYEIFKKKAGVDLSKASKDDLYKKAKDLSIKVEKSFGRGRLIDLIFKKTARPTLIEPCFLVDPPVDIEPLAKRHGDNENKVERFQVVAFGTELGKGFSEANDPIDQRERFEEQMKLREKGDSEAQRIDEDFLEALEYGMPPTAGFGLSERLFSVLAGQPIRETVFFPPMRKKKKDKDLEL